MFVRYREVTSQRLPQCCKHLSKTILTHLLYRDLIADGRVDPCDVYQIEKKILVDHEGFVRIWGRFVSFDERRGDVLACTPEDLNVYADVRFGRRLDTPHELYMLKLLMRDRWYKGDRSRLLKIIRADNPKALVAFACNAIWERGYEDHYTLGQQLSIRITTKLIQSGLDFKHHSDNAAADGENGTSSAAATSAAAANKQYGGRGWHDRNFEKFVSSFSSISDIIKRHRGSNKYIVLELLPDRADELKACMSKEFTVVDNALMENVCAITVDDDKNSMQYLVKLCPLIKSRTINVIFVTDLDYYMKCNEYMFYLYNSLKFYYYCLKNKFVFLKSDHEIIFLLNVIVSLEWCNKGHLNSFTLEKSAIYNPLELSTRRLNSLKRAAAQSRRVQNDNEIKIDFIQGKRIKTGTHYGHRMVMLNKL
ncbi:transcription regulator P47 [Spodoptera littoralis nucleopolyhedrovirus]|uniref:Transcription regulator P47 n=1 Tax=Spodoptera littoralis nuclear polyhedrosis virus TaxID=10456 RepID=M1JSF3_NPVSL|nr:transcription regulator P47 [Spodoptera littoralis nucleopolyhedrovirus]AGE89887.1 transcription regulator P47 [Spodoptera littoralis nucleopolyhedrovirus]AYU75224.1 transcription regulator P47 [Spodoptera littoralis nucleopolyhedrovirus]